MNQIICYSFRSRSHAGEMGADMEILVANVPGISSQPGYPAQRPDSSRKFS